MSILPALCTGCGACWAECPRQAIVELGRTLRGGQYAVLASACTLCREHLAGPRCRAACPVLGCIVEIEVT